MRRIEFSEKDYKDYKEGLAAKQIAARKGCSIGAVTRALVRANIKTRTCSERTRFYKLNEAYFDVLDSEEKAYWLGFLFADGSIETRGTGLTFELKESDSCMVQALKAALGAEHPLKRIYHPKSKSYSTKLYISGQKLKASLASHGLHPRKSYGSFIFPVRLPWQLANHFVRGYFDGDGSVYRVSGSERLGIDITSNEAFLKAVQQLLSAAGIASSIHPSKRSISFNLSVSRPDVQKFAQWLYYDATIFLPRKRMRFEEFKYI